MKRICCLLLAISVLLGAIFMTACGDGEHTVEFYIGDKLVHTERTVNGRFDYEYNGEENSGKIVTFLGWYLDKELTEKLNSYYVDKDMKLYGKISVYTPMTPGYGN